MPRTLLVLLAGFLLAIPAPVTARQLPQDPPRQYTVVGGDTLWSLARRLLGDPHRWPELVEANKDRLSGPQGLEVGMVLVIPGADPVPPPAATAPPEEPSPAADTVARPSVEAVPPAADTAPRTPPADSAGPARVAVVAVPGGARPAPDTSAPVPVRRADPVEPAPVDPPAPERTPFNRRPAPEPAAEAPEPESESAGDAAIPAGVHASAPFLVPAAATEAAPTSLGDPVDAVVRSARVGDRLAIRGDGDLLAEGARLQAYRRLPRLVGRERVAVPTGVLRVESSGPDAAIVVVESSFDRLTPGDRVRRLPPAPEGGAAGTEPAREQVHATVVGTAHPRGVLTPGDWVFLDAGGAHGVRPGDEFVPASPDNDLRPGGRLQVVVVQDSTATARVIGVGARLLEVGAAVRLDRRLR